ncbi:MAG TPA: redoxin domain-containing protein [Actinoplanes sp.]|jgi:peroxiredoxin
MRLTQRTGDTETLRRQFDRDGIWQRTVRPGDRVPSAVLVEADLGPIHLDRLRMTGPVVLVFVKYAGSAVCESTLERYERELAPAVDAHIVAVSPQVPARLAALKRRHDLSYFVASDPRHVLIDAFNLGFAEPGADVILGTGRSVLPFPAVVVADRAGVVRYADIRPDGSPHPGTSGILTALGVRARPGRTTY